MTTRHLYPQATYRLPPETREQLRGIAAHHGLGTETAAIRLLIAKEAERIERARLKPVKFR